MLRPLCLYILITASAAAPAYGGVKALDRAVDRLCAAAAGAGLAGKAVAVIPFRSPDGSISVLGGMFADRLTARLIKKGAATVLDRRYLGRVMGELKLEASGFVEPSGAAALGRFTGADLLIMGSLAAGPGGDMLYADLRLVETATGKAAAAAHEELPLDKDLRGLFSVLSAVDSEAEGLASGDRTSFIDRPPGAGGCRWVRAYAAAPVAGDPAWAAAEALGLARARAAAKGGGLAPAGYEPAGLENLVAGTQAGAFSGEKITEKAGERERSVVLEACVPPARQSKPGGLRVELLLSRGSFSEGEAARAFVSASSAALVYIYSMDMYGSAALLFPAAGEPNLVAPGRPLVFPGEDSDHELKAVLPPGARSSVELLRAFALEPGSQTDLFGAASYRDIVERLEASGSSWAEAAAVIYIHK